MSITQNIIRVGNFTSSNIHKLMVKGKGELGFGAAAITYIKSRNVERRLGRSLEIEKSTRAMLWGKFLEKRVHDLLPLDYETCSNASVAHPKYDYWVGSPDNKNESQKVVGDTKCYEPENFCAYVDVITQKDVKLFREEFPKEYWQLVSNACILGYDFIEPIAYMPYESELSIIREMAENNPDNDFWKYRFIAEAPLSELPYLPDGGYYKNLNIVRFDIPQEDKQRLTEAVEKAGTLLDPRTSILSATQDKEVKATIVEPLK